MKKIIVRYSTVNTEHLILQKEVSGKETLLFVKC